MCLDVSPDGATIVFDLLGDLWTLPMLGGRATRLTVGPGLHRQPRYSPDGKRLVFVSDRAGNENVWIADRYGQGAWQLSDLDARGEASLVTSPTWSPDGETIIVSRLWNAPIPAAENGSYEEDKWLLAAYDLGTRQTRWVSDTTAGRARGALGATVARDGRTAYAAVDEARGSTWLEAAAWRIAQVDLKTGVIVPETSPLPSVGAPAGLRPAVSPDGRYLAYVRSGGSRMGLRIRDLRTDQEWWLIREALDNPAFHLGEPRDLAPGYAFTPDSKSVILAYGGKIHRVSVATGQASIIPFVVSVERRLGALTIHPFSLPDTAVRTRSVLQPAMSPDGHWVAFSALDRLWLMRLPQNSESAGEPFRATLDSAFGEFYPSWSPDGQWIVYSTWEDGDGGAVRRVRVTHDAPDLRQPSERLTKDTAAYFHTAVTSDGRRVLAVRALASPKQVFASVRPADAFQLVALPTHPSGHAETVLPLASEYSADLSYPVGQVYATSDADNIHVGLKSWSLTAKAASRLTVITAARAGWSVEFGAIGALSPDRCRALIESHHTLYELRFSECATGNADTLDLVKAQGQMTAQTAGAARRWGSVSAPWVSWSLHGNRVLFSQGGTLFVGDVRASEWTTFRRVDVPLRIPVDIPRGTLVLSGARLLTMRRGQVIERGDLVVKDNRILALGASGHVTIPPGSQFVDLRGHTILPGYVDIHDHPRLPAGLHTQQVWDGLVRLAHGVTSYRDPQPACGNDVFTYRERERSGQLLSPRIFATGAPFYDPSDPILTAGEAEDLITPNADYFGSETFKLYHTLRSDRRTRQLVARAIADLGLNATAHTGGPESQVAAAIDGVSGIEHPPGIQIYEDVAKLMAQSGTTQTHTYVLIPGAINYMLRHHGGAWSWARMRRFVPPFARSGVCSSCMGQEWPAYGPAELDYLRPLLGGAARIVTQGGKVGIGSHGSIPGVGLHYEMWLHVLGGMRNDEVLRAATIAGATAIGHGNDFGSLEPGKLADLQVLDKNPLDDIHQTLSIRYVMKNGRLYRADNLTQVWPRSEPLAAIYFPSDSSSP